MSHLWKVWVLFELVWPSLEYSYYPGGGHITLDISTAQLFNAKVKTCHMQTRESVMYVKRC